MTREKAEKWIADNNKKPAMSIVGDFYWMYEIPQENQLPSEDLPQSVYENLSVENQSKNYPTEAEAYEDLIQALMKRPDEPEVDVKAMAEAYAADVHGYPFYDTVPCMVHSKKDFIAGFEAAKRGNA